LTTAMPIRRGMNETVLHTMWSLPSYKDHRRQ
jgi:hypothetical protein